MGSFRQLLLIAFMLIAALLSATALRAVVILERLVAQSGLEAARALELNGAAQALDAHTAGMERAGRQSLVLNDSVLRRRFEEEWRAALGALDQMHASGLAGPDFAIWRSQADGINRQLEGPLFSALDRERAVAGEFRDLDAVNDRIRAQAQALIESRNAALAGKLDAERSRLMQQVLAAIALALLLAVGFGIWLARPFKRLEHAIVQLGENRLAEPIDISGPSDVRAVSQQLDWLRLRLTELDADKARFLRHVSHELKTPLAALHEGVALLQDGVAGQLVGHQKEVVGILRQNTLALQAQIEALLRFNAAAFEARQLQRRRTDLLELLREQVEAQRLQWQARGLNVEIEGEPLHQMVDPGKLGAAIGNLLSNAIRFSPRGGTLRIQLSQTDAAVRIDVRDQGPGVAPADRERVFEPFYRGARQPEGAVRGTGIGLSIVQEYVTAHGGHVRLESDSQAGHFRIELPHAN
ncbi:HAMP domain-containing protein [Caenimonas sedimenti]|uniref:histidine kinase n=1 Tax=Caenimonas sedimenti TaxID=2596921 RepID=A0A562ZHP8_9BURK|nr:ATP-binding protein [Caenimonas sedimenti]TWO67838.1 HAMP domain-containing protein [Caenimonas sedimenti]